MSQPRFAGESVTVGGQLFVVPAPSVSIQRRHSAPIAQLMRRVLEPSQPPLTLAEAQQLNELRIQCAYELLRRNYPDLSLQEFEDLFDEPSVQAVIDAAARAVRGQSGNAPASQPTPSTGTH